jgi:ribosomal protein S27AE
MSKLFNCPQCGGTEFTIVENIAVDSEGRVLQSEDNGLRKCANCGSRFMLAANEVPSVAQFSPQNQANRPRVRSSVSAADRGVPRLDELDRR